MITGSFDRYLLFSNRFTEAKNTRQFPVENCKYFVKGIRFIAYVWLEVPLCLCKAKVTLTDFG